MFAQSSVCTLCRFNTGSINSAPISRSRENFCRIKNCIYRNRGFFIFLQDAKKRNMTAFARALTLCHGIRRRNVPVEKAARLSSSISPACRNAPSMMPPPCSESDSTPKVSAKVCIAERRSSPFVPANK